MRMRMRRESVGEECVKAKTSRAIIIFLLGIRKEIALMLINRILTYGL